MPDGEGAVDATITITIDGEARECGVTLIPGYDGALSTWGPSRDFWADDSTAEALDVWADSLDEDGDARDARELVGEIEAAVRQAQEQL
jgi:hypothetical protein